MSKEQQGQQPPALARMARIRSKAKNGKATISDEKAHVEGNTSNKKKTKRIINRGAAKGSAKKSPERPTTAHKKDPSKFVAKKKDDQPKENPPTPTPPTPTGPLRKRGTVRRRKAPVPVPTPGDQPEKEVTKVDCTVEDNSGSKRSVYRKPGRMTLTVDRDRDSLKATSSAKKKVAKPTTITSGEREIQESETVEDQLSAEPPEDSNKIKKRHNSSSNHNQSNQSNEVVRDLMKKWVERTLSKGVQGLRAEFEELRKWTPENATNNAFTANPLRNRYRDVNCLDESRVKLVNHPEGIDYIHANWVHTDMKRNRFICAQGPTPVTNYDFWHLIVQENVRTIVMLCNCVEKFAKKCEQYWPLAVYQTLTFKNITVTTTSVTKMEKAPSIQITVMKVVINGKEEEVRHYQWLNWPDRGVPKSDDTVFQLLAAIREEKNPIVVHCSAGIGRTGSVVFIEMLLEKLHKKMDASDMGEMLKQLRRQRAQSVQTDIQYLYVHHAILKYFYQMRVIDKCEQLLTFNEEYEKLALAAAAF